MKKIFAVIFMTGFLLSLVCGLALAQRPPRDPADIKAEIKRVESYIDTLNDKLSFAKSPYRVQQLKKMIAMYEARLGSLENELESVAPGSRPQPKAPPATSQPQGIAPSSFQAALPPRTIGISGGLVANIPAIIVEVRVNQPFDLVSTELKLGLGYAKGTDSNNDERQHLPLFVDGIYRLTPPGTRGLNPYLGLGLNLDLYTIFNQEGKTGSTGADLFFGLDGSAGGGRIFLEAGYHILRTGFSPDYKGLGLLIGYRQPW